MAENDLVEEAYSYKYLVRTDVKNFYPSVYTHSIAWALHSRTLIRKGNNRGDFNLLGNRLDKLFQNANDGCTNGLPIGPVVSDLIAEIILSAVDLNISPQLKSMGVLALRFKDDYRFLCRSTEDCKKVTKLLQKGLKEFNLLLSEDKTEIATLPEGIFREWRTRYDPISPKKGTKITFKKFKELYLGVLRIDCEVPGTGIIERFLVDVTDKSYAPLFPVSLFDINKIISLLLLLAEKRIRSFPRILGVIESMMVQAKDPRINLKVEKHLNKLLSDLNKDPEDNKYLISWILYFLNSNRLNVLKTVEYTDPIIMSVKSNRNNMFAPSDNFKLFRGARETRHSGQLLKHLDAFKRK